MAWPSKKIKTTCMSWKSVCWQYYSIGSRCWRATQIFPTCWKKLVSLPTITGQIESAISSLLIVMFKDLSERHFIDFFIWESMTCFYITLNNFYISLLKNFNHFIFKVIISRLGWYTWDFNVCSIVLIVCFYIFF